MSMYIRKRIYDISKQKREKKLIGETIQNRDYDLLQNHEKMFEQGKMIDNSGEKPL